jgi:hypothetical protein
MPRLLMTARRRELSRYSALVAIAAVCIVGCNSSPPASKTTENTVGGANVFSSAETPLTKRATSLSLGWGSKGHAGQLAIADVLSYGGSKPTITAPAGWQLIRDDSTKTTRQSLYWHAIQANDPGSATWTFSQPVNAQGAIVLLDNAATTAPVDVTSGNTSEEGDLTAKSVATTTDGDLILAFYATDFVNEGLSPKLPADESVVLNHESSPLEYWILASYQTRMGDTGPEVCDIPQFFQGVAAQVAIKRGAATSSTP